MTTQYNAIQMQLNQMDTFINKVIKHEGYREPIEPNINEVTFWQLCYEHYPDRILDSTSIAWLFANEYYRMQINKDKGDL